MEATPRSLALDHTRSAAWNNLGLCLSHKSEWHEAIEAFDRALDCDPQNTGAILNASEPLIKLRRIGEAVIRLKRATTIAPDKFSIWTNLASVYVMIEDKANALECYQKARDLAPARYFHEIDEWIQRARSLPDNPTAVALMAAGRFAEAQEYLRNQTEEKPDDKGLWHNLGLCYLDHDFSAARRCFEHVHLIDPADGFAVCRLIELSAMLKDFPAAEHWCGVLERLPECGMLAIAFKARALAKCDRFQYAKTFILNAVRKHPDEPDVLIACGDVMMVNPKVGMAMSNATIAYGRAVDILRQQGNLKSDEFSFAFLKRLRFGDGRRSIAL